MSVRNEPAVRSPDIGAPDLHDHRRANQSSGSCLCPMLQSLTWMSCRVAVRAVIDDAAELYVVTPSLPGRLAWLATELNPSRHAADERLDAVLGPHALDRRPGQWDDRR